MKIVPITLKEANGFVASYHRHHGPTVGCKFAIGLQSNGDLVGVAICGRPVSRYLDDGLTLEVNRLCTDGTKMLVACFTAQRAELLKRWDIAK